MEETQSLKRRVVVFLDEEVMDRLDGVAKEFGLSRSSYVAQAIMKDLLNWEATQRRLNMPVRNK